MYLHFLRILQSLDGNRKLCFQQQKFGSRHIVFDFQNRTYPLLAHTSPVTSIGEFFDFLDILNTAVTFICFLIKRNTHFVLERPNKKKYHTDPIFSSYFSKSVLILLPISIEPNISILSSLEYLK